MRKSILLLPAPAILLMTVLVSSCSNDTGHVAVGSGTRYVNNAGGPQTVKLPDGSHVVLMDGTTIVVSKGFGKEDRDVEIDGQGLFVVQAPGMGSKPFVVHTGNLIIQVLDTTGAGGSAGSGAGGSVAGTGGWDARFAVEAVRKQPGEESDLLDGKLRVTKSYHSDTDNEPEVLGAGDMVMINREIDLMEKEKMTGPEEDKVKEKYHIADK
jgi:hypothetical protein